jgi:MFS family permease
MAQPRSLNPFHALQANRNFRLFWLGQTTSLIGTWMTTVATGWLALELTNSAFLVGVVSAASSFPILLLSLYAGVIADRYNKLRIVTICQALQLSQSALLWWFTWSHQITFGSLLALVTFGGLISSFEIPARQAMMVELVEREDLIDAIALNSGGFNLARIVGPSIAAVVIARAGLQWCFGLDALSYFSVLLSLSLIRLPKWSPVRNLVTPFEGLKEGFRYMRGSRAVSGLIGVIAVYSIFGFMYLTMMPVFARQVLHTGASGYGFLLTFVGAGALTGALALAALGGRVRRGRLFAISAFAFAILTIAFAFAQFVALAAALLLCLGLTMLINGALANGMLQSAVPDELRGRVMATYVFVYVGFTPIGSFIAGGISHFLGVRWAIGLGGGIMLLYSLWAFWKFPEIREA